MQVVFEYENVTRVKMWIPVAVGVRTIWYIILGFLWWVIYNIFNIFGCRPISFGRIWLVIGRWITVLIIMVVNLTIYWALRIWRLCGIRKWFVFIFSNYFTLTQTRMYKRACVEMLCSSAGRPHRPARLNSTLLLNLWWNSENNIFRNNILYYLWWPHYELYIF